MTKKNHAKSRNLLGQKITQPLRTKKSHNLSGQKNQATSLGIKITQPFGTNKITQPLGTNKLCNILGQQKNPVTYRDNKKSCNLLGPKQITQPLGTKKNHATSPEKKSCNLSGPKNIMQDHATSWEKNSRNLLGHKKSYNLLG